MEENAHTAKKLSKRKNLDNFLLYYNIINKSKK